MILETSIEYLKGVGPQRAELFKRELNIHTFRDLLAYFPFRYVDKSHFVPIAQINSDTTYVLLKGHFTKIETIGVGAKARMVAHFADESGSIELVWFKGIKWLKDKFQFGKEYIIFGKPSLFNRSYNIPHPDVDLAEDEKVVKEAFHPLYNTSETMKNRGLNSKAISKVMQNLMIQVEHQIPEVLPPSIIAKYRLVSREKAFMDIHFPKNTEDLKRAQNRLKFEELFFLQLTILREKVHKHKTPGHVFTHVGDAFNRFYNENLPFQLTGAQQRVIKEIRKDLGNGIQMNRLLQGDVGSGKTLVALMCMLIAIDNGFQACIMAPTEILATQHYKSIAKFLQGLDIEVALLTGSTKTSERKIIHEDLQSGKLKILIGTHALIESAVVFQNLGLVVIDEQHRFGVEQRSKMWQKNKIPPHILVMTATPIPRTLAMTLYGDLDVSVIDELPPNRKPIQTFHRYDNARLNVFAFMRKQIEEGRQVYVIYPLINESDKLELKDLMDGYDSITREFPLPKFAVSIVHGQMKSDAKDYEMQRFAKGETQIMVATTVIEVGVDVPNASVMVIENAERFGLSQLHQLRGRVGRGASHSYCILMTKDKLSSDAIQRIGTMVRTSNGFEIAEADLKLRGPGDLQGTQQSGALDLKIADLVKDESIIRAARDTAMELIQRDPQFREPENIHIKTFFEQNRLKSYWAKIS